VARPGGKKLRGNSSHWDVNRGKWDIKKVLFPKTGVENGNTGTLGGCGKALNKGTFEMCKGGEKKTLGEYTPGGAMKKLGGVLVKRRELVCPSTFP